MSLSGFQVDEEYWGDRLEVGTELVVQQYGRDAHMRRWIAAMNPRCRAVVVEHLGLEPDDDFRAAAFARRAELLPFLLLVDEVMEGKRACSIEQVARGRLSPEALAASQRPTLVPGLTSYDRRALMWRLYLADPTNLELVFHFDRLQRKGVARMVAGGAPPINGTKPGDFLTLPTLQRLLDGFETEQDTMRQSHCAAVLNGDGHYRVFIKRDTSPAFVSHGPKNTFGFKREWIGLVFEPDLRRVKICSATPTVPPQLADRIASSFFGVPVAYEDEVVETPAGTVAAFLSSLLTDPERLPLVELVVKECGLDGSPQLRLSAPGGTSIAPAVRQLGGLVGDPLGSIDKIASIKVWACDKRVKLVFERVDDSGAGYVVRYADQPLTSSERRAFEERMWRDHGIRVLSTNKKRRHAA